MVFGEVSGLLRHRTSPLSGAAFDLVTTPCRSIE
jgi:hypothetical protein